MSIINKLKDNNVYYIACAYFCLEILISFNYDNRVLVIIMLINSVINMILLLEKNTKFYHKVRSGVNKRDRDKDLFCCIYVP